MAHFDDDLALHVKALAIEAGFARVGIAPAGDVLDGRRFVEWLQRGFHASMGYLARNVGKRLRPDRLVPGSRSVICLAVGYAPSPEDPAPQVSVARYARGRDYHKLLRRRCQRLMDRIRAAEPGFGGRAFVDSAPVLERSLAQAAGLGWIGRNCCLIAPGLGSYVLLCEIVCNLPLRPDGPVEGGCRDCGACVRACPTGALSEAGLDARRCVSYLTVEHAGRIEPALRPGMGTCLVGCDRCQVVCPQNADAPPGDGELRGDGLALGGALLGGVLGWTEDQWDAATRGSAARRVRYAELLRNAVLAAGNSAGAPEAPALAGALGDLRSRREDLHDMIDWALGRLARP